MGRERCKSPPPWLPLLTLLLLTHDSKAEESSFLAPSQVMLAYNKPVHATSTCGELNGLPFKEIYCSLAGSTQYSPHSPYSYTVDGELPLALRELRGPDEASILGGHGCQVCEAGTQYAHPPGNMVDGNTSWWQSPPLSRGMSYNEVNITIDLEQEYHVGYVWIQMANSPKPGTWVLERSIDGGATFQPWQYFAENAAECMRRFGVESLLPITEDDQVICRSDMSSIQPLENGELMVNLMEGRPSRHNFSSSPGLQSFTRANAVRIRLMGTRTLQGHLMDLNENSDPTVTRRYYYAIKEIHLGGRCVCHGHAATCDVLDPRRPKAQLCRCEHNTCGDMCEQCCPGYVQKKWQASVPCEQCNCHGRSSDCVYDEELDRKNGSLDIHGVYSGGGRCLNCRENTEGVNCDKCSKGFYRPADRKWTDAQPCVHCRCDPYRHTDVCDEETGRCGCLARFEGENCDQCAPGYYSPPECKPCECAVNGTNGQICLPISGQCPCKVGFTGTFCDSCDSGHTNFGAGCPACSCSEAGSTDAQCDIETSQCTCKLGFASLSCDQCATGYYNYPNCTFCACSEAGTDGGECDAETSQCLCRIGFAGDRCDRCDEGFYGYPACKPCECVGAGTESETCDSISGQCSCKANFTGRICDRCLPGFHSYPRCEACDCLPIGSKGTTCDDQGQCYCHDNFEGERCDRCRPNFYNFPTCEECNCNPRGVSRDFRGCDKVAPGELCTCRGNVAGRRCDQCLPTFWDLQAHHEQGCIDCACNTNGTLSRLNICAPSTGQCECRRSVGGRACDRCADGFYELEAHSHTGCKPCDCDVGGSMRGDCSPTGQCRCKPRISGARCDQPITNHYFPTLWHIKAEAEDGRSSDNRSPARFAFDSKEFANFSWRGFAVFSPIQEQVYMDIQVPKSSVYRVLLRYRNPLASPAPVVVTLTPTHATNQDVEQSEKATLAPSGDLPATHQLAPTGRPFVLNPGIWTISVAAKQRLYLDFVVLLPSEYYEAPALRHKASQQCRTDTPANETCVELLYAPLPDAAFATAEEGDIVAEDGAALDKVPIEQLPSSVGTAVLVKSGEAAENPGAAKTVQTKDLPVPESTDYAVVIEYFSPHERLAPVNVTLHQDGNQVGPRSEIILNHCPYTTFCRELAVLYGQPARYSLKKDQPVVVKLDVDSGEDGSQGAGIGSVAIVPLDKWNADYLKQVAHCVRRDGECHPQRFPPAIGAITTEAESGAAENEANAVTGRRLPFGVANPDDLKVVPLFETPGTIFVTGAVPAPDHYAFLVHYFNPDNAPATVDVLLQNDKHAYHAALPLGYCPAVGGCLALVRDKERPEIVEFHMDDKYTLAIQHSPDALKSAAYIDSVTTVPHRSFSPRLLEPLALDVSSDFAHHCSADHFENPNQTVTPFCSKAIFSLTSDFLGSTLPCECSPQGSESFCCDTYGGQCKCKPLIIGRQCNRCAPGHFGFPECQKCECSNGELCDEHTGQCACLPHVEGRSCDRCVQSAFGFDALIGCQLCGCHPQGSQGGQLQCDPTNGQCLCRESVGGRRCDTCLPGAYGFPHCHACRCDLAGTTESVCDQNTAICNCKENVEGARCDTCRQGTFNLATENAVGCTSCFCFGVTDSCQSSHYPVTVKHIDQSLWRVTDAAGGVVSTLKGDFVEYAPKNGSAEKHVYFIVPLVYGQDFVSSYGLKMTYTIKCWSAPGAESSAVVSTAPDVILTGGPNLTAHFYANEQPANFSEPFTVSATLAAEQWVSPDGGPISRANLLLILRELKNATIKACFLERPFYATLSSFDFEVADPTASSSDLRVRAGSVELCACPAPYTGSSCQNCAEGYYRVDSGGPYLGSCVPCECNGHSGTCDPQTGICIECEDNTMGEHCELCVEGYYGDATTGSPYSCQPCECPFAGSNHARSCHVSDAGLLESCDCREGYSSERCDRCASGFFGNPTQPGGSCRPCECNQNNNLTDPRACHPGTGVCFLCDGHTTGPRCEICEKWYWGDAITEKNCTECSCNQCGTYRCDASLGSCECMRNVVGENCDRCAPDHWGYDGCAGCQRCECAAAAATTQCDLNNGQCTCLSGAVGRRCELCDHGFWNYTSLGCQKCDCESDLSLGTVCDVMTGQCHCQEGASGSRCDQCLPGYLRIPELGCRRCDECVHVLVDDVNRLDSLIETANATIANISTASVAGAQLARIQKSHNDLTQCLEFITDVPEELNRLEQAFRNVSGDVNGGRQRSSDGRARLEASLAKAKNVSELGETVMSNARDIASIASMVIRQIHELGAVLGGQARRVEHRPEWQHHAFQLVEEINKRAGESFDPLDEKLKEISEKNDAFAQSVSKRVGELNDKKSSLVDRTTRLQQLQAALQDFRHLLRNATATIDASSMRIRPSTFALTSAIGGITADAGLAQKNVESGETAVAKIPDLLATYDEQMDKIKELVAEYEKALEQLPPTARLRMRRNYYDRQQQQQRDLNRRIATEQHREHRRRVILHRMRRQLNAEDLETKVRELNETAAQLRDTFGSTKHDAASAIQAANVYTELTNLLRNASQQAEDAETVVEEGIEERAGQNDSLVATRLETEDMRQMMVELRDSALADVDAAAVRLQNNVSRAEKDIDAIKKRADALKGLGQLGDKGEASRQRNTQSMERVDSSDEKVQNTLAVLEDYRKRLDEARKKANHIVGQAADAVQNRKTTEGSVQKIEQQTPEALAAFERYLSWATNKTAAVDKLIGSLSSLKERVAIAREAVNRIRLGAHFPAAPKSTRSSTYLSLPIPQPVARIATHTDVSLFFKTAEPNGLLTFLGNEVGSSGTRSLPTDDFLALELKDGKPRVVVDLGAGASVLELDTTANDNEWRKLSVVRTGRLIRCTLSAPNAANTIVEEKKIDISGRKSVLNLHPTISKLFVGGVPAASQISREIASRVFAGDLVQLTVDGEPIGLWNTVENGTQGGVDGASRRRPVGDESETTGIGLTGTGYLVHAPGMWAPKKRAAIRLSFLTFQSSALLFYVDGQDKEFLAIRLVDGAAELQFRVGTNEPTAPTVVRSQVSGLDDGAWHTIAVTRDGAKANIEVDGQVSGEVTDASEGELNIRNNFYLGGVPGDVELKLTEQVPRFSGCLKAVELDGSWVDPNGAIASKGVQSTCTVSTVRVVTLDSKEDSKTELDGLTLIDAKPASITLKFKTRQPAGSLFAIVDADQKPILSADYERGRLVIRSSLDDRDIAHLPLESPVSNGKWHYLGVERTAQWLHIDLDDYYAIDVQRNASGESEEPTPVSLVFRSFAGCLGDVVLNGALIDFSKTKHDNLQLTGCAAIKTIGGGKSSVGAEGDSDNVVVDDDDDDDEQTASTKAAQDEEELARRPTTTVLPTDETNEPVEAEEAITTTEAPAVPLPQEDADVEGAPKPVGQCALARSPPEKGAKSEEKIGGDEDAKRFGLHAHSRLEFDSAPDAFDKESNFSVLVRPSALSGVLLFATNQKHTDYVGVYLHHGYLHLVLNTGGAKPETLRAEERLSTSKKSRVTVERSAKRLAIYIDGKLVAERLNNGSAMLETMDAQPPVYLGGVPTSLTPMLGRIAPGVKTEFGGCAHALQLNGKDFERHDREEGTVPCWKSQESGLFFGERGGYVLLHPHFNVAQPLSAELEFKARSENYVLLSVGVLEYVRLEVINGTMRFAVNTGVGDEEQLIHENADNQLCDGHWHVVKVFKRKNLVTLTVDGRSQMKLMRKQPAGGQQAQQQQQQQQQQSTAASAAQSPLYIGGLPPNAKLPAGLHTTESFAGCLRVGYVGEKLDARAAKQVDWSSAQYMGDVVKSGCPVQ